MGRVPVRLGVVEIGAAGTLALGTDLVPADADSGLFPPERASGPASDLDYAGYVVLEALDPYPSDPGPQTRWPTRVLVAAVVAWRSVGGDNASVNYSTVLINPSVIPVPGP